MIGTVSCADILAAGELGQKPFGQRAFGLQFSSSGNCLGDEFKIFVGCQESLAAHKLFQRIEAMVHDQSSVIIGSGMSKAFNSSRAILAIESTQIYPSATVAICED